MKTITVRKLRTEISVSKFAFLMVNKVISNLEALKSGDNLQLKANGYMDFHVDCLYKTGKRVLIVTAHKYTQDGRRVTHVEMGVLIDFENETVVPTYCQLDSPALYKECAELELNKLDVVRVDDRELIKQTDYLKTWLMLLAKQGHK